MRSNFRVNLIFIVILCLYFIGCTAQGTGSAGGNTTIISGGNSTDPYSIIPQKLMVPPMGYDDSSITVIWSKPSDYTNVASYNIYIDGSRYNTSNLFYNFSGLSPDTYYSFYVTSVMKDGSESYRSHYISGKTSHPAVFNITTYGAVGDGVTVNTASIQAAINACTPGGKVLIPAGSTFVSGSIFLKSNMTLQIDGTLSGSTNAADYLFGLWRFPYYANSIYFSLINAYPVSDYTTTPFPTPFDMSTTGSPGSHYNQLTNIRICGSGIINGSSDAPLNDGTITGKNELGNTTLANNQMIAKGGAVSAANEIYRGDLISIKGVTNFFMGCSNGNFYKDGNTSVFPLYASKNDQYNGPFTGGLKIFNPPCHTIVVSYCKNVTIDGVNTQTFDIHNADGVEICTSDTSYVFNSNFDTGDDCINLNAGQGAVGVSDGYTDTNIRIFNNDTSRGHGGVVFGSFTAAWIQNVLIEDCTFSGTDIGLRFKTGINNGGGAVLVTARDLVIQNVVNPDTTINNKPDSAIHLVSNYDAGASYGTAAPGMFKDLTFKNIKCNNIKNYGIYIDGTYKTASGYVQYSNLKFDNITISGGIKGGVFISTLTNSVFNKIDLSLQMLSPWTIDTGTSPGSPTTPYSGTSSNLVFTDCNPIPAVIY
jgi:exo-poly-alpha-galacturonosidase